MGETHCGPLGKTASYALYSSLSPGFQKYLEGLAALHSAVAQAEGARAQGLHVRREPVENIHPVVRVHPVTGWKSIYVNKGFTRRIVGVPKAESDAILQFLFLQLSENVDFQVRFRWETNSVAIFRSLLTRLPSTSGRKLATRCARLPTARNLNL